MGWLFPPERLKKLMVGWVYNLEAVNEKRVERLDKTEVYKSLIIAC